MKPNKTQLETALAAAERLREADEDPEFVARALIYLAGRHELLDRVFRVAERFVKFGMDESEHRELVRAIEAVRHFDDTAEDRIDLGLGSSN